MGNWKRRRREAAIAERKKPFTTRGLGERRKLPSGVWGSAPETDAILNNFLAKLSTFWALVNLIFCNNQIEERRLSVLDNYMKKDIYFDFRSVVGRAVVIGAFGAEGRWFDSTSSRHVETLGKQASSTCIAWVMHKCIMVKVGGDEIHHKVCIKQVDFCKTGVKFFKVGGNNNFREAEGEMY